MSIRIALENAPDFFTNLDVVRGRIVLGISRHENIGAIIVKLEGESKTALTLPPGFTPEGQTQGPAGPGGSIIAENHKILYKVQQVFPPEDASPMALPLVLAPGQHEFPFSFRLPFNNICGDPKALANTTRIGGGGGGGGSGGSGGPFGGYGGGGPGLLGAIGGIGGIRVMDSSRQLFYQHVKKTLPPSFTGIPRQAEIRYYIKVTIQRPGLFKENWRYQMGFKFMPIEPPRPRPTNEEAYARRPFTFKPRAPAAARPAGQTRRSSLFDSSAAAAKSGSGSGSGSAFADVKQPRQSRASEDSPGGSSSPSSSSSSATPSIEMSARLPHPAILTCNRPVPLRLIAKKLSAARETVFLVSLQIDLVGTTHVRCNELVNTETSRWVVAGRHGLAIPVSAADDPVGTETAVPDTIWRDVPLPNTVMPSFVTCNLSRDYQLEIKLGLSWGLPPQSGGGGGAGSALAGLFGRKGSASAAYESTAGVAQAIHLPLHFSSVEVYSGLTPPPSLVEALRKQQQQQQQQDAKPRPYSSRPGPPVPPRRPSQQPAPPQQQQQRPPDPSDPLYPPQLRPGQEAPPYDDAPPSYSEAMAEEMTGPVFPEGQARPGYSGVTDVDAPSLLPEKRG